MRLNPSMAEPSKVMPSSRAFSSSAGVMLKVFGVPRTSVNHSCTNLMARSSTVLKHVFLLAAHVASDAARRSGPTRSSQA